MKRKAVLAAVGFFFGAFVSFYLDVREIFIFMAAVLVCLILFLFLPESRRGACMFIALCTLLSSVYSLVTYVSKIEPLEALDGEEVTVKGTVSDYTLSDSSVVTVSGNVRGIACKLIAYINNFNGELGDEISFIGKISKLENSPFFNSRSYYLPDGIYLTASVVDDLKVTPSEPTLASTIRLFSRSVGDKIRSNVGGTAGEVLSAMICGDSSHISDSTRLILNRAGIGHIAAVSGLHLTVVAFSLMFVLKALRCPRILSAVICESGVLIFVVFSGMRVSCIRAAIMMSVYILSTLVKRKSDPLNTLSVAALLIMLANLYAAVDVSFCLSLAGTFGVSVAAPYVIDLLKLKSSALKALTLCICASACTMPFVILNFNELSLVAPLMNIVLVPICSLALVLGMVYCVLGALAPLSWLILFSGKLIEGVIAVCKWVAGLDFTYIATGRTDAYYIVTIIIVLALAAFILKGSRKLVALSLVAGICLFVSTSAVSITKDENITLDILTSGTNCCVLLRKSDECIIIDFDGGKMADECESFIEKNGISSIKAVLISQNGEAGYSSYLNLSVTPDSVYLPRGSYIFGGNVEYFDIPERICVYGFDIRLRDGLLIVSQNGKSIAVSKDDYFAVGTLANVCVSNGISVVNADEQYVYKDDAIFSLEIA